MRSRKTTVPEHLDLAAIGATNGFLWNSDEFCLVGKGVSQRIPITLSDPDSVEAAKSALAEAGSTAFAALPFDRSQLGELVVPEVVVGSDGSNAWLIAAGEMSDHDAWEFLVEATEPTDTPSSFEVKSILAPEHWRDEIVANAISLIKSGRLDKVVLARELEIVASSPIDIAAVLKRLRANYSTATRFNVEGFIGASPEILVRRNGQVVGAHPLAGTAPRFEDPSEDAASASGLEASMKDQWEHRITIEWLLDTLLPFCSYVDAEPEPQIVTLANVHHLGTRVEGMLSDPAAHVLELVAALHPTPAVGGAPQAEALKVISEIEGADRKLYAGPTGWVDANGNGSFAVAIRSATVDGNSARLFAGVGVVAHSDPQSELDETESKFQTMRRALLNQ